jgi:uncharacterized damage-inducible protein DinB
MVLSCCGALMSTIDAIDVIRRLHQHRAWVNHKLLEAAEALTDEALHRPLSIGQGSVWKSLLHMFAAEHVWLAALQGEKNALAPGDVAGKLPGNQAGEGAARSLAEVKSRWSDLEARWNAYLEQLSTDQLEQDVEKVSSTGMQFATRRCDVLLHVCTHAHYTTAQVVNMLRQLGATPLPDVMLISLARQDSARA